MHSKLNSSIVWEQINPEAYVFVVSFPFTSSAPSALNKTPLPRKSLSFPYRVIRTSNTSTHSQGRTLDSRIVVVLSSPCQSYGSSARLLSYPSNKPFIITSAFDPAVTFAAQNMSLNYTPPPPKKRHFSEYM
jgi:hypothetical protein